MWNTSIFLFTFTFTSTSTSASCLAVSSDDEFWQQIIIPTMSMLQNAPHLRSAPFVRDISSGAAQRIDQPIYVFVYNHFYDWSIFHRYFPMSNVLGTACLGGWTWHINANGQPNIRRAYISPSTTIPPSQRLVWPSPTTESASSTTRISTPCTFGYIFSLPSTADRLLHRHFSPHNTRIRALFPVEVCISTSPKRYVRLNAIAYFDPRHTSDLRRDVVLSSAQKKSWQAGLDLLRKTGAVPRAYAQAIAAKLNGAGEVEAVWVCPREDEETGMDLRFLARDRVEEDVVIVDHVDSPAGRCAPLNSSVNQGEGTASGRGPPRSLVLVSGTSTDVISNSSSNSDPNRRPTDKSMSPMRAGIVKRRLSAADRDTITINVDPGNGSITQLGSASPQKRARNPFAKANPDRDGSGPRPAKKARKISFGPAPRARRRR